MDIEKVGKFLKNSRKRLGFTQSYVANQIGVSPQAVSKWERGENMPDITYFPDISKIYQVSIKDILKEGIVGNEENKLPSQNIKLFENIIFEGLISNINSSDNIENIDVTLDHFIYMNDSQKHMILNSIMQKPDYIIALEEILPYTNKRHRLQIVANILQKKDFENLEEISVYMNNDMKQIALDCILAEKRLDIIEQIITIFNRKHRNCIVEHLNEIITDINVIENLMPFFDKSQIEKLREVYII